MANIKINNLQPIDVELVELTNEETSEINGGFLKFFAGLVVGVLIGAAVRTGGTVNANVTIPLGGGGGGLSTGNPYIHFV